MAAPLELLMLVMLEFVMVIFCIPLAPPFKFIPAACVLLFRVRLCMSACLTP